jgi:hypothetical protein
MLKRELGKNIIRNKKVGHNNNDILMTLLYLLMFIIKIYFMLNNYF